MQVQGDFGCCRKIPIPRIQHHLKNGTPLTANIMAKLNHAVTVTNVQTQPSISSHQRLPNSQTMIVSNDETLLFNQ